MSEFDGPTFVAVKPDRCGPVSVDLPQPNCHAIRQCKPKQSSSESHSDCVPASDESVQQCGCGCPLTDAWSSYKSTSVWPSYHDSCSESSSSSCSSSSDDLCCDCKENGPRGPRGKTGCRGPVGRQGDPGPAGPDGKNGTFDGCVFYTALESDISDQGPGIFVLNFTRPQVVSCNGMDWDGNSVYLNEEASGTFAFYYQFMPTYPAKIFVQYTFNATAAILPGTTFGRDYSVSLDTTGFSSSFYNGQVILPIPPSAKIQFFMQSNYSSEIDDFNGHVTLVRLTRDLVLPPWV